MSNFCELCDKTFASSRSLASHRYSFHRKNDIFENTNMSDDETIITNNSGDQNHQKHETDSLSKTGNSIDLKF